MKDSQQNQDQPTTLPDGRIRILCVDDNRDLNDALRMLFGTQSDMEWVGCLASADTVLEAVRRLRPAVIIMDLNMRGKNPRDALRELHAADASIATILFSACEEEDLVTRAAEAGALGCVSKYSDPMTIVHAVRSVASGQRFFPPAMG